MTEHSYLMDKRNYGRNVTIASFAVFIVLFISYFILHQNTQIISSDNTTMFPMIMDFLDGNHLLSDWNVNTSTYLFTDTLWCLPLMLLGVHVPTIMSLVSALFHAGFVSVFLFIILSDEKKRIKSPLVALYAAGLYLMLFAVVPYAGYTIDNPFYLYLNLNGHAGTFLFMAVEFLLLHLWRESGYKNKVFPVIFTVYGVMGQMSDTMPLMVFFGPLCVYGVYSLVWPKLEERNRKKDVFLIITPILIVAAASLINKIIGWCGGLKLIGVPMSLNTPDKIMANIKPMMIKTLILFGYDTKYGITITPYVVIASAIAVLVAASVIYQIALALRSVPDRFGLLLALGIVSNLVGFFFINTDGESASRYLMSIPFFGTALAVKFVLSFADRKETVKRILFALVFIIAFGYAAYNLVNIRKIPNYAVDGEAAAAYLEERGVENGYGSIWIYTAVSSYTDFDTLLIPIQWDGLGVGFYHHNVFTNPMWFDHDDIHYVVVQSDEDDLYSMGGVRSDFIKFAGEPDEDMVFGTYEVMYYERDLSVFSITNAMETGTNMQDQVAGN